MKRAMKSNLKTIILLLVLPAAFPGSLQAETGDGAIEPSLDLRYLKNTEDQIVLTATVVYYLDRQPVPLPGCIIHFTAGEDSVLYLGSVQTDKEGIAVLTLDHFPASSADAEGTVRFRAGYSGNDTLAEAEMDAYVKDVNLQASLKMIDSVRTVTAHATRVIDGDTVPAADEDIYFQVKRMFSNLPVEEGFLDENGEMSIDFPNDIPGDADGYLEVIVKFDENYEFGNVEKRERIQWGVPTHHQRPESYRALWTQIAPLWMIITLTIMLTGVWSHYLYVIIQLFRIRRMGRNMETK